MRQSIYRTRRKKYPALPKTQEESILQLYTIHVYYGGHYVPLVCVLLPNKQERAYQQILYILKQQCLTMGLNLSPAVIMLDFEVSAMNAFRTVLPTASIRCCRFHMGSGQAMTVRSVTSVWHRHIKMMQKLGSG